LSVSSALGIYVGLTQSLRKPLAWLLLAAGCFIPLIILVMS